MAVNPLAVYPQNPGGLFRALNITAATVVKNLPGQIYRIIVNTVGTAGSLTINDNNATGGTNNAANTILTIPFGSLTLGQVITLECDTNVGITVSAVTTGGVFAVTYS